MTSERQVWVAAAGPAVLGGVLFGSVLFGLSLKCSGDLEAVLGGATGKQALVPMLLHALTRPVGLLAFALPLFLGLWALLVAVPRLRHRPALSVAVGLFPFVALTVGAYAVSPHVCDPGPSAQALALMSGGILAALAGGIVLATRNGS